jgi:hypothetical protein
MAIRSILYQPMGSPGLESAAPLSAPISGGLPTIRQRDQGAARAGLEGRREDFGPERSAESDHIRSQIFAATCGSQS